MQTRYAAGVEKTYFVGGSICGSSGGSAGGREALLAAKNWLQNFDGEIVLYPAWNAAALDLQFGRIARELAKSGAYLSRAKRKVLFDAALSACDELDGAKDGQQRQGV